MRLLKHFPVQPSKSSETTWTFDEVDRVALADYAKGPSDPDVTDTPRPRGVRAAAAPPNALTASTFPYLSLSDYGTSNALIDTPESTRRTTVGAREPREEEWLQPPNMW